MANLKLGNEGTMDGKKLHWDTWTKIVKNDLTITLYGVFVFQKSFFLKKESASTQEERGSKKGSKISDSFVPIFCIAKTESRFLLHKKTFEFVYCKLSSKSSVLDDKYRQTTQS